MDSPTQREVTTIERLLFKDSMQFVNKPLFYYYSEKTNLELRRFSISVIVRYWTDEAADALVPCLAIKYFDSFMSLSLEGKNPDEALSMRCDFKKVRLVTISCLIIAAKERGSTANLLSELINSDFVAYELHKMVEEVRNCIESYLKLVTPFCFLEYCCETFEEFRDIDLGCIIGMIIQARIEDEFVKCKAAVIAFSSFLAAMKILDPNKDLSSTQLPYLLTRCDKELLEFCTKKGIRIEKAGPGPETAISSMSETGSRRQDKREEEADPLVHCPKELKNFVLPWPVDNIEKNIKSFLYLETMQPPSKEYYSAPIILELRKFAVSKIVRYWADEEADAFVPYLAITFFDTFVSLLGCDVEFCRFIKDKENASLLAISCLIIVAKKRDSTAQLKEAAIYLEFNAEKIDDMVEKIESRIKSYMTPVTPFCFLEHYCQILERSGYGEIKIPYIIDALIKAHGVGEFVTYNASEIAFSCFHAAMTPGIDHPFTKLTDRQIHCARKMNEFCINEGIAIEIAGLKKCDVMVEEMKEVALSDDPLDYCRNELTNCVLQWPNGFASDILYREVEHNVVDEVNDEDEEPTYFESPYFEADQGDEVSDENDGYHDYSGDEHNDEENENDEP